LMSGGAEWQRTDGVYVVAEEDRGAVDVRADSDYQSGFGSAGYGGNTWRATFRANVATEDRGNGTPLQINNTEWRQFGGDASGAVLGGFWTARISGGTQDYFQTFSAIAPDRQTERLTNDQTIPGNFVTGGGQWVRTWKAADVLIGAEARRTTADINETRYAVNGTATSSSLPGVEEQNESLYGRVKFALRSDLALIVGARGDHWKSTRSENFFSPRATMTCSSLLRARTGRQRSTSSIADSASATSSRIPIRCSLRNG